MIQFEEHIFSFMGGKNHQLENARERKGLPQNLWLMAKGGSELDRIE